jgi:hypothetical protein
MIIWVWLLLDLPERPPGSWSNATEFGMVKKGAPSATRPPWWIPPANRMTDILSVP